MKPLSRHMLLVLSIALLALSVLGCSEELQETDSGGVALSVNWPLAPNSIGVSDQDSVVVDQVQINSIILNPGSATSNLMNVELSALEVSFTRADNGTRVPVPTVIQLLGTVPVGGSLTYSDLPVMGLEQLDATPLSDLRFENGGIDRETGNSYIRLNVNIRVFGRTLGGEDVVSRLRGQTIEFVPSLVTRF